MLRRTQDEGEIDHFRGQEITLNINRNARFGNVCSCAVADVSAGVSAGVSVGILGKGFGMVDGWMLKVRWKVGRGSHILLSNLSRMRHGQRQQLSVNFTIPGSFGLAVARALSRRIDDLL